MQTAFNSAAVRLAMLDAVADADYRVPQSVIDKALLPFYQDETGRYSSKRYNETPELQRATNRALMTEELNRRAQRRDDSRQPGRPLRGQKEL
jgi:cellulose synthase/poly-beta-1,6-N-acetylglucosamine synthase-like glycosyltransferase